MYLLLIGLIVLAALFDVLRRTDSELKRLEAWLLVLLLQIK